MPFGLAGGPSSYACLVHMVLDGIPYTQALPYLDDTVIHSMDLAGHFLALDRVLEAYKKARLKLQPAKCQLLQREIEYLGHMVSAKGKAPVPGYVQVVKDWPMPRIDRRCVPSWERRVIFVASWRITQKSLAH
jgi:hypothetical protein